MPRKELNIKDGKPRYKSLTVDAEVVEMLNRRADQFFDTFGFRPTVSQTIRHVLAKEENR